MSSFIEYKKKRWCNKCVSKKFIFFILLIYQDETYEVVESSSPDKNLKNDKLITKRITSLTITFNAILILKFYSLFCNEVKITSKPTHVNSCNTLL